MTSQTLTVLIIMGFVCYVRYDEIYRVFIKKFQPKDGDITFTLKKIHAVIATIVATMIFIVCLFYTLKAWQQNN